MEYSIGDRVVIVDMFVREEQGGWNSTGRMDKWCGKTMTIIGFNGEYYTMEEDQKDRIDQGWCWYPWMIAGLAEDNTELFDTAEDTQLNEFLIGFKQG